MAIGPHLEALARQKYMASQPGQDAIALPAYASLITELQANYVVIIVEFLGLVPTFLTVACSDLSIEPGILGAHVPLWLLYREL